MDEIRELLKKPSAEGIAAFNDRVISDNFKQRDELRTLKAENEELKKKVPGEGAVVLVGEDAKAHAAYVALGKPDEIKASLDKKTELEQKEAMREREATAAAAAEAAGFNAKVLLKLPGAEKMKFEVVTEKVNGEDVPVAYVTGPEQGAQRKKLDEEHVEATWPGFLPALQATDAVTTEQRPGTTPAIPRQRAASSSSGAGLKPEEVATRKRESGMYTSL